jgi:transcription initiation factor TFIIIB Brf1 subunit/transcription initiation factor TFIIB
MLSYEQFHMYYIVGACLFLSTKICEVPRTLRSIVNVIYTTMNKTTEPLGAGKVSHCM